MVLIDQLTGIANAIREQTKKENKMTLNEMAQEIRELGGILADETFEITTRTTTGEIPIYTSERLKNLSWYVVLIYENISMTPYRTVANLGWKTAQTTSDRIKIYCNSSGTFGAGQTSGTPIIDTNGTIKFEPYSSSYAIQINEYRLIVIGE